MIIILIIHYLCSDSTATRPITEKAQCRYYYYITNKCVKTTAIERVYEIAQWKIATTYTLNRNIRKIRRRKILLINNDTVLRKPVEMMMMMMMINLVSSILYYLYAEPTAQGQLQTQHSVDKSNYIWTNTT
jgi:hypothetical protein